MKICLVSDTMATMAGTEHSVVMTATSLAARGHEVALLAYCCDGPVHAIWRRHLEGAGVALCEIPVERETGDAALRAAAGFLEARRADIVHAIPLESLGRNFVAIARQAGRGAVIGTLTSDPAPTNFWYDDLSTENLARYDHIICPSGELTERFRRFRLDGDHVVTIPHIVGPPRPAWDSDHWALDDACWEGRRSLGAITRLREEKGPDFLMAALSMIVEEEPEATLTIHGELVELERTRNVAKALGVERNVIWSGPFDGLEEIDRIVRRHCIFLLSSLFESMPISLMEVIARGRPVVATDVGAVSELLGKTGGGRIVRAGDPRAMADAVLALLRGGEAVRRRAAEAARAYHRLFAADAAIGALERLYAASLAKAQAAA